MYTAHDGMIKVIIYQNNTLKAFTPDFFNLTVDTLLAFLTFNVP